MTSHLPIIRVTDIGEFIRFHSCERRFKLKYNQYALIKEQLPNQLSQLIFSTSLDPVLQQSGRLREAEWEDSLINAGLINLTKCVHNTSNRSTNWENFVAKLTNIAIGQNAYGREVAVDGKIGAFYIKGQIDFIILSWKNNQPQLLLVEAKASRKDHTYQRAQVTMYRMLVRQLIQNHKIYIDGQQLNSENVEAVVVRIDETTNKIQNILKLKPYDLDSVESDLNNLLKIGGKLEKIVQTNLDQINYQLDPKCSECVLSVHCLAESTRLRRLELLGIDPSAIRALNAVGINNIDDLAELDLDGLQATQIYKNINFTENLELLQQKAKSRRRTLHKGNNYTKEYEVSTFSNYSAHPQQTLLPCHSIDNTPLVRIFLSIEYDYVENRIAALCAHVTNSKGKLDTGFKQENGQLQPDPVVKEFFKTGDNNDQYLEQTLQGKDVIKFKKTPWTGDYAEDSQAEAQLIEKFFTQLVKAIANVAKAKKAPIHFYVWSKQEMTQLLEGCARAGTKSLAHLRELMGLRRDLNNEQLIYTNLDREVDQCFALGWTGRDIAVVTALKWFDACYHWRRMVNGEPIYLDRQEGFFRDVFDFVKYDVRVDPAGNWANSSTSKDMQKMEVKLRYFNSLSAAYWRGYWGILPNPDDPKLDSKTRNAIKDYNNARKAGYLKEYLRARTQAIRWIEERFPNWLLNDEIDKPFILINNLNKYSLNTNNVTQAAIDVLRFDHHIKFTDWISRHLVPPGYRISEGRTLPIKNVLLQVNSLFDRQLTATINFENYDIDLEVLKANCTLEKGSFVRVTPSNSNPKKGQTIKQLTSGIGFTCIINNIDWDNYQIQLQVIHSSKSNRYQLKGNINCNQGQIFDYATIDESPSDFVAAKVNCQLDNCFSHHANSWFDQTSPKIPEQVDLPSTKLQAFQKYLSSLTIRRSDGSKTNLHSDQIKSIYEGMTSRIQLLQGPPGTGKTDTTAIATFIRILARLQPGNIVIVTASTHTAVDTLLLRIDKYLPTLEQHSDDLNIPRPPIILSRVDVRNDNCQQFSNTNVELFDSYKCTDQVETMRSQGVLVIGGTITGILKVAKCMSHDFQVSTLIVDEASMMVFPHFLSLATLVAKNGEIMLAGDHRQLSPIISHDWENEDRPPVILYQPYVSAYQAVQNLKNGEAYSIPNSAILCSALTYTFRLPPIIRHLIARLYKLDNIQLAGHNLFSKSSVHTSNKNFWQSIWQEEGLFLVVHSESNSRKSNQFEVSLIEHIIKSQNNLNNNSVAIVTPHRAQRTLLKNSLADYNDVIKVIDTVEKLQGGECQNIFVSATASDPVAIGKNVEFILDLNRSNVAFSRAQKRLVVVCSQSLLNYIPADIENYNETMLWKELRSICSQLVETKKINSYEVQLFTPVKNFYDL